MADSARASILLLDEAEGGQAMVRMKDGDTFFVAAAEAARACSVFDKLKDFGPQFSALLADLSQWVMDRRAQIRSAFLTLRDRDMLFLVIQKDVEFDQSLSEELTQLDLRIANSDEYSLISLEVLCIPSVSNESAQAFLSSGQVLVYAK